MNKLFIILLLFSIGAKPLYQLGYVVYYEMNLEYVIERYCINKEKPKLNCDGKCYLMQQLSAADNPAEDQDKRIPKIIEIFTPLFFQSNSYERTLVLESIQKSIDLGITANYFSPTMQVHLPPPKF